MAQNTGNIVTVLLFWSVSQPNNQISYLSSLSNGQAGTVDSLLIPLQLLPSLLLLLGWLAVENNCRSGDGGSGENMTADAMLKGHN